MLANIGKSHGCAQVDRFWHAHVHGQQRLWWSTCRHVHAQEPSFHYLMSALHLELNLISNGPAYCSWLSRLKNASSTGGARTPPPKMDSSQRMAQSQRDQQTADYKPEQRKSPESNSQKQYSQPKVGDGCT